MRGRQLDKSATLENDGRTLAGKGWTARVLTSTLRRDQGTFMRVRLFIPLLLALICYLLLESQAKKLRAKNEAAM